MEGVALLSASISEVYGTPSCGRGALSGGGAGSLPAGGLYPAGGMRRRRLANIPAAGRREAPPCTQPAGQEVGLACSRRACQEARAASHPPPAWRRPEQPGPLPPACPKMLPTRVRGGCEPVRPNDIAQADAAAWQDRAHGAAPDWEARPPDRSGDSLSHCARYGATNRPFTHPYKRATQLEAPRSFAHCPKILAKPGKFYGNPGEKVMIV